MALGKPTLNDLWPPSVCGMGITTCGWGMVGDITMEFFTGAALICVAMEVEFSFVVIDVAARGAELSGVEAESGGADPGGSFSERFGTTRSGAGSVESSSTET